jgi:leucyl-tRNA synthetase
MYLGGMEHTTLHLLYSRFWHQFLYDQKLVPTPEPYAARRGQGIVLAADGRKMSKSLGNVINPSDIVAKYGADTLRLYVLFMAPYDEATPWSDERLGGVNRFAHRVWSLVSQLAANTTPSGDPDGELVTHVDRLVHKTNKRVHDDLGGMRFNTAIAALMELLNELGTPAVYKQLLDPRHAELAARTARQLTLMVAPFAPYLAEELWHSLGAGESVHVQPWPPYDEALIRDDVAELAVQVNGKLRGTVVVTVDASEDEVTAAAKANPNVAKHLTGTIVKTIVVPRRLVNFVVKG